MIQQHHPLTTFMCSITKTEFLQQTQAHVCFPVAPKTNLFKEKANLTMIGVCELSSPSATIGQNILVCF